MRLAIVSDIHSNYIALAACIKEIKKQQLDGIVLLGDYVSDCPHPGETLKMLRQLRQEYTTWAIRGNREEYFIEYDDGTITDWNYSSYKGSLLYTYEHLKKEDLAWFRSMDNHMVVHIPETEPILIAHGSSNCSRELLDQGEENTMEFMRAQEHKYIVCGHTHRQCTYEYQGKTLINPGSVGVAIGVKKMAHFTILEWDGLRWIAEHQAVPYDFEKLKDCFYQSGLMEKGKIWPLAIMKSIETGVNYGPLCAKRAYDLAIEHQENIVDRIVPERYWEIAARELGVLKSESSTK